MAQRFLKTNYMKRNSFQLFNLLSAIFIATLSMGCKKDSPVSNTATVPIVVPVNGPVSTLAPNGTGRESVEGKGVTVDQLGNFYLAEDYFNRITKVSPSGIVTVFAGKEGTESCCGDVGGPLFADGPGSVAEFLHPNGVAVDAAGNVYVADAGNYRIRKINPQGVVSTVAGSGTQGFLDSDSGALVARFTVPLGITADQSGNIYVSDGNFFGYRIRKITPSGIVTTLAGNGLRGFADGDGANAEFDSPTGLAVDESGNVYVADAGNNRIRKITPSGFVTTLAGSGIFGYADGNPSAAQFSYPSGVAVDSSDNVYVADANNNRIRKITPAGLVNTLAGNGILGSVDGDYSSAEFALPVGITVDRSGNVYVVSDASGGIRKIKQ
jgi:hypothetical protein